MTAYADLTFSIGQTVYKLDETNRNITDGQVYKVWDYDAATNRYKLVNFHDGSGYIYAQPADITDRVYEVFKLACYYDGEPHSYTRCQGTPTYARLDKALNHASDKGGQGFGFYVIRHASAVKVQSFKLREVAFSDSGLYLATDNI